MKRTAILLGIVLIFLTTIANGQDQTEPAEETKTQNVVFSPGPSTAIRYLQLMVQREQEGKLISFRFGMEHDQIYQEMIGLSDAQKKYIEDKNEEIGDKMESSYKENFEKLNRSQELSPEELAAAEDEFFGTFSTIIDELDANVRETMTPVQLQKALEYELAAPSLIFRDIFADEELSMNFAAYDALDLTDEQKGEIDKIKDEMNKDAESIFSELKDLAAKAIPEMEKEPSEESQAKLMEKITAIGEKAKTLVKKSQEKVREKLTKEQRETLDNIREEHAKKIAKIKEELEKKAKDDSWKDVWKPGDPLPEGAVPPVKERRFPLRM